MEKEKIGEKRGLKGGRHERKVIKTDRKEVKN